MCRNAADTFSPGGDRGTFVSVSYPLRVEVPGGYYHVGTRGNDKRSIYEDDRDRDLFMLILRRVARRHGWLFSAYCLMGNHYHLIVQIGESGISRGMCELNTSYAVTSNARHRRTNHLFGRRFWSELITTNAYLLQACRYVVQNPVRAGLCGSCEDWKWSSYRAMIGVALPPPYLAVEDLLGIVAPGGADPINQFREYCETIVPKRPAR
jgi:putative transposase